VSLTRSLIGEDAAKIARRAASPRASAVTYGALAPGRRRAARADRDARRVVLLSPACASFDMFDNFEHRGEVFKKLVERLMNRDELSADVGVWESALPPIQLPEVAPDFGFRLLVCSRRRGDGLLRERDRGADRFHDPYFFLKKQLFWALLGAGVHVDGDPLDYRGSEGPCSRRSIVAGVLLVLVLVRRSARRSTARGAGSGSGPCRSSPRSWRSSRSCSISPRFSRRSARSSRSSARAAAAAAVGRLWPGSCCAAGPRQLPDADRADVRAAVLAGARAPPGSSLARRCRRCRAGDLDGAVSAAPHLAFIDPWVDPRGSGFQIIQSWLALGNGGVFGQGIGASRQKLFYLPESHTDFIFAISARSSGSWAPSPSSRSSSC
jgi:hypothetical protein